MKLLTPNRNIIRLTKHSKNRLTFITFDQLVFYVGTACSANVMNDVRTAIIIIVIIATAAMMMLLLAAASAAAVTASMSFSPSSYLFINFGSAMHYCAPTNDNDAN
jgi:hypothetical protein